MIRLAYQTLRDTRLRTLDHDSLRAGAWVYAVCPSEEEIAWLKERCGLDEDFARDALDPFEMPRYEVYDGVVYFFLRFPLEREGENITAPALLAVTPEYVVTLAQERIPAWEALFADSTTIVSEVPTTQRTKFFLYLLRRVVDAYTASLNHMQRQVQRYRTHPRHLTERTIDIFVHYENTLNEFLSALVPMSAGIDQLLRKAGVPLFEEDVDFVEDLQLAVGQLLERCRAVLKTTQNIRNAFSAIATNRLNLIVKRLTTLTVILAILTVVTSLWGMNVPVPFAEHPRGFWIVLALAMAIAGGVGWWFAKIRWL
ncbi:magnesium transporter CorA family protein [Candidatus Parcubacteria bacterium]|jgi:magnesium transporter|nr:MAG: magnesium transporter CorA family protein [Candidatus Parcubacteria bacterium]GIW68773.1 MAG: magnesium transporter [Candidatus Parcubacteria bacterium]